MSTSSAGVMPPDEYQEAANNSIYTNLVANLAVNTARWTECLLNGEAAAETAVPDAWLEKMKNLVFLFNGEKRYHEEFEGFDDELVNGKCKPINSKLAQIVKSLCVFDVKQFKMK